MRPANQTQRPAEGLPDAERLGREHADGGAASRLWRTGAVLIGSGLVASGLRRRSLAGAVAAPAAAAAGGRAGGQ